ncbi:MAG: HAMP domain-containing sensor histidine kinase [Bacteroidales bacterium]|jgi:two-component system phosphate regulon sensor histidine kinase PhoR|nr:HAMP domain-containing sensor histidine kinase [Bacteroidales bacterium]
MKKRNTVLILGIISIILLITVQLIIINGVWRQKDEMFNLRYRLFSQDALTSINRRLGTDGFDTARMMIDNFAEKAVAEISNMTDSAAIELKKQDFLYFVRFVLNEEQDLSGLISDYFERRRVDKNFRHKIIINYLELISNDRRFPVYISEEYNARRPVRRDTTGRQVPEGRQRPARMSSEILVKADRSERNYYRLDFDYFIDFTDKQKIVLRETSASLALSILSILVVVTLFYITYKNLMEEKRLSNLKTDFINNMTHELKTPLSTITVAGKTLELPLIRSDENKILETAKMIGKQSVHLNQLINMILEISMWERTQFQLDKKKVNISNFMNDIVESFRSGGGSIATISQKYNFDAREIELDTVYFTTMINNLLSNAVKYSDKEPVIEIEGFTENNSVSIKVADNGIGIGKNDQKHVFDKFYRASSGNIHKYKGLGLGLYYVKKIAEAHGGDVTVASKPGKGSIFTITIPY